MQNQQRRRKRAVAAVDERRAVCQRTLPPTHNAIATAPPTYLTTPQDRETDANSQKASHVTRYSLSDYGGFGHAH